MLYIDFTKTDHLKNVEDVLVSIDVFFNWATPFVTIKQKALTIAKVYVDKWFYIYDIPTCKHNEKKCCLKHEIMEMCIPFVEFNSQ